MIHASAEKKRLESVSGFTAALRTHELTLTWDVCDSPLCVASPSETSYCCQTRVLPFQTSLIILEKYTKDACVSTPLFPLLDLL